jgi:hypothetical protein
MSSSDESGQTRPASDENRQRRRSTATAVDSAVGGERRRGVNRRVDFCCKWTDGGGGVGGAASSSAAAATGGTFHCRQRSHFLLTDRHLPGALFSLKRKKMYEAELDKIGNIKMTLETQVMNLESAAQNAETFMVMNQGKIAMAGIRVNTDIEKVDELMDEIKEEMEAANEISNALAQPVDPLLHDEDDLLAELEQMSATRG